MKFYALKVTTVLQRIHESLFVNDDRLFASCMTSYLIFNKELQVHYTSETVYSPFSHCNFLLYNGPGGAAAEVLLIIV